MKTKFSKLVEMAIEMDITSYEALAREFEVAIFTVIGWTLGKSKPHKVLQKQVVRYLKEQLDLCISDWLDDGQDLRALDTLVEEFNE